MNFSLSLAISSGMVYNTYVYLIIKCRGYGESRIYLSLVNQNSEKENIFMKNFEGILICTDLDGTLLASDKSISAENTAAIERFKEGGDDYNALLYQSVADRVVEAASEYMHRQMRYNWYFAYDNHKELIEAEDRLTIPQLFAAKYRGIRPAVGYSCLPNQRIIFDIDRVLHLKDIGISLTESGAMYPQSSVCGLYINSEVAKYFIIA